MTSHHHGPNCQEMLTQLCDYIDGELASAICIELEQHLADCPDCRVLVDTTRKTIRLYSRYNEQTALPPDATARLWQALSEAGCVPPDQN